VNESKHMKMFISHSSTDTELARALSRWLKAAFVNLRPSELRCTSIDGHGLQVGTDFAEQLRSDVCACEALIVLVTPNALRSQYVLLELGARWGTTLPILPVAVGVSDPSKALPLPLAALHAVDGRVDTQMLALLKRLSKLTALETETPDAHLHELNTFAALASTLAADQNLIPHAAPEQSSNEQVIGRIASPTDHSQVPQRTLVSGELTRLNPASTAWLVVAAKNGRLYPQSPLPRSQGKWTQAVNIGRSQSGVDTGFEYTIMLVAAGSESSYMFERCIRGHAESDDGIAKNSMRTSDLALIDSRVVVRAD
jgi:hypothetical protein